MSTPRVDPAKRDAAPHCARGDDERAALVQGAHPHGYLLTSGPPHAGGASATASPGWRTRTDLLPGATLHLHPRTVLSAAEQGSPDGRHTIVLLGHPVDAAAGTADGTRIAHDLLASWLTSGEEALVRQAAELGGRWTLFAGVGQRAADSSAPPAPPRSSTTLLVIPDTHATQPVFHAVAGDHLALGSTPALVAEILDLPVDESALTLLDELATRRKGAVTYLPGRRTAYRGLDPLVPNCLLRIDLADHPTHRPTIAQERFWPWRERVETRDVDAVYRAFRARIGAHTDLLASLGRPVLSLTAGGDSAVTAAIAHRQVRERDGFAFTYVNPRDARRGPAALADVTGASAVAAQLGIAHRVLRWRQPEAGGAFDELHRRTYAPLVPSRGAAHAMWADLPRSGAAGPDDQPGLVQLQSNCGETGTTFIRHRTDEPLSPLRLARMMMNATDGLEDLAEQMYGDYLDYAQLSPARLLGYDHHDVFYWEQRIGRWGWQKFTDGDFGHRILLPFNDRVLLETMLSLPYPLREARVLFAKVLAEVPAARVPTVRPPRLPAVTRALGGTLPGRVGKGLDRRARRAVDGLGRSAALRRFGFARGYAVSPAGAAPPVRGWSRQALPGGQATLHVHPGLSHAVVGDERRWVLALGEPVAICAGRPGAGVVGAGVVGAEPVAAGLHELLSGGDFSGGDAEGQGTSGTAVRAAALLAGSWLVVLHDGSSDGGTVVLTDALGSIPAYPSTDGRGVRSHRGLDPAESDAAVADPLGPDSYAWTAGPLGITPLEVRPLDAVLTDEHLAEIAEAAERDGITRSSRLTAHVDLLRSLGPVRLGLTGDEGSGELLDLLARSSDVRAVTWWDRLADDSAAEEVFAASARAAEAGVPHRVLGVREDVDGGRAGELAREHAHAALERTMSSPRSGSAPRDMLALGPVLDDALPASAVLWLGATRVSQESAGSSTETSTDRSIGSARARVWDQVQGVRQIALPFSDRLLPLLPQ
ncbi:hypothetical protein [Ornithinimicrobium sp. Y1694]|uniref:hypothetical protein n=1 Tax=Ornithinimicrobium sp. Y1694 TaxID=3418590 RepID=UPI003CF3CC50